MGANTMWPVDLARRSWLQAKMGTLADGLVGHQPLPSARTHVRSKGQELPLLASRPGIGLWTPKGELLGLETQKGDFNFGGVWVKPSAWKLEIQAALFYGRH